jgi:hypothetical protein
MNRPGRKVKCFFTLVQGPVKASCNAAESVFGNRLTIGDRNCDLEDNVAVCAYDGGDCCIPEKSVSNCHLKEKGAITKLQYIDGVKHYSRVVPILETYGRKLKDYGTSGVIMWTLVHAVSKFVTLT